MSTHYTSKQRLLLNKTKQTMINNQNKILESIIMEQITEPKQESPKLEPEPKPIEPPKPTEPPKSEPTEPPKPVVVQPPPMPKKHKLNNEGGFVVQCPHCQEPTIILSVNCAIFRHASYKHNYEQVSPHASKQECERLIREGKVLGCCMPFRLIQKGSEYEAVKCDFV